MKAAQYAEALYGATRTQDEAGIDHAVMRLGEILRSRGHGRLFPAIVREFEKIAEERDATVETIVRVARADDAVQHRNAIAADLALLAPASVQGQGTARERVVVDEHVVGGYEVRAYGKRIDRTFKRSLLALYNDLVR
jgi:F0F1-type ATP synthase delta subunit